MNLSNFSTEQLEKELEKRKAVKPRATPETVLQVIAGYDLRKAEVFDIIRSNLKALDWTPQEPREWEKKFILFRREQTYEWGIDKISQKDKWLRSGFEVIPFEGNGHKLWEVTK